HEVYICGNPPFLGKGDRSDQQTADMAKVFNGVKNFKNLDLVSSWFLKASRYLLSPNTASQAAFVATNSVVQGEQASILWPVVLQGSIEIRFAYQTFKWKN